MARKSVGFVHMEWRCPNCDTRNKGTNKICSNCATAQPADVAFEQTAQETLIEDEALIAQAKAGPDVHCPFCGTRNPATAVQCKSCLGELTEGVARSKGIVLGEHRAEPVPDVICSYCQTTNPGTAFVCSNCTRPLHKTKPQPKETPQKATPTPPAAQSRRVSPLLYLFLAIALFACGYLFFLSIQRDETVGQVSNVEWERTIQIEGLVPVSSEGWLDEIPQSAEVGFCREEVRFSSPNPQPNSQEVCGEPYTVDTGTGIGELVQDCEYLVYDDLCSYTVDEWQVISEERAAGNDFASFWPSTTLSSTEREGEYEESYRVVFDADGRSYSYRPNSFDAFTRFTIGSDWILELNGFNAVVDVSPR